MNWDCHLGSPHALGAEEAVAVANSTAVCLVTCFKKLHRLANQKSNICIYIDLEEATAGSRILLAHIATEVRKLAEQKIRSHGVDLL
jgi:hypothetical protein